MNKRIAVPLDGIPSVCTLPDGRRMETSRARTLGYTIASRASLETDPSAAPSPMKARIAYAQKIEALPEARTRPSAAAAIYANQSEASMPPEKAASFLRGLPEEKPNMSSQDSSGPSPELLRRFERALSIRIAGLSVRADRGDENARSQVRKLTTAISLRRNTGASYGDCLTNVGIDARPLITELLR